MTGSLAIDRFEVVGIAPADHPDPSRLTQLMHTIDQRMLTRSISSALTDFGNSDGRFIVLKRLEIATSESSIRSPEALARQLAEGVYAALTRLADAEAGDNAVVYSSHAARNAAFIQAAVRDSAWGKWWFDDFDHLKHLPLSSAVRVVLGRAPPFGLEVLQTFCDQDRLNTLQCLSDVDATDLLNDLAQGLPEGNFEAESDKVFSLPLPSRRLSSPQNVLNDLAVYAKTAPPTRATLLGAQVRLQMLRSQDIPALVRSVRSGSLKGLAAAVPQVAPLRLAAIARLTASKRARIAIMLERGEEDRSQPAFTPFGGVLLLWPHLPRIDVDLLPSAACNPMSILGLISLASIFASDAAAALEDRVLREALDIPQGMTVNDFADWQEQIPPEILAPCRWKLQDSALPPSFSRSPKRQRRIRAIGLAAAYDFSRRLPGLATASLPFLRANILRTGARLVESTDGLHAILERPPLDVLLSITGLAERTVILPHGRALTLERSR